MKAFPRNRDYPEALVNILLTIMEKTPHGGATLEDLQEAYQNARGKFPSKRTIDRNLRRLNQLIDPLAYEKDTCLGDHGAPHEDAGEADYPQPIKRERRGGQVRYFFTRDLTRRSLDPGMALLLALSLYPQQRGLLGEQYEAVLQLVFQDLLGKLAVYFNLLGEIEQHVYVSGFTLANPQKSFRIITEVLRAIRNRKRVKMQYVKAANGELVKREVEPFGLLCRLNNWYLVGRCCEQGERRVYLLDHIRRLEVVENSVANVPPGFSLRETYGSAWGVWTEAGQGEAEKVRLRVEKRLAEKFRVTRYHDSQIVKELPDGDIEVTFVLTGAEEMIPWLMGWGPTMEVLEPAWLKEAFIRNLEGTLRIYR